MDKTPTDKLTIFAATSLRDAFNTMEKTFLLTHPNVELSFHYAGTQELRTQLEQGAIADIFASADRNHMDALLRTAQVTHPVVFAHNEPIVVVSTEAFAILRKFSDLPSASRIVIGAPEVPIGRYTLQILDRAKNKLGANFRSQVEAKVISHELNVRQVLNKVSMGEAQAGLVYRSDVATNSSQVHTLPIPPDINVLAEYSIAIVTKSTNQEPAQAWIEFVLSVPGQAILQKVGFLSADRIHP